MSPSPNASTLERLITAELYGEDETNLATLSLHDERYNFAAQYVKTGKVLDIACGEGY